MTDDGALARRMVRPRRAYGPAGIPFNVMQLAPFLWLDPSQASSVTIATGISQINDLSGNAHHFTQATGANQPPYATGGSGINSKGAMQGTGVANQCLNCVHTLNAIFGSATNAEINCVAKLAADSVQDPFGTSWSSADSGDYFEFSDGHTYSGFCASTRNTGNSVGVGVLTSPFVWEVQSSTGAFNININWSNNFTTATNTFTTGAVNPLILNSSTGGTSMTGLVGELIVTPILTTGLRSQLRAYLAAKWGTP